MSLLFSTLELAGLERHLPNVPAPASYRPPQEFPPIHRAKAISFDIESHDPFLKTRGPGFRRDAYIVGYGIRTLDEQVKGYWPIRHVNGPNCNPEKTEQWLRDEAAKFKGEIIGANLLYDGDGCQVAGIRFPNARWHDCQFAEPLLDEQAFSYSLETLAKKYNLEEKGSAWLKGLYGDNVMEFFREVHPAHAETYSLQDTLLPIQILAKQKPLLAKEHLTGLFELESRLIPVLLYMRELGIRVDLEAAETAERYLAEKRDHNLRIMEQVVGFPVDPASNQDLARACEHLGVSFPHTAPTNNFPQGQPSFQGVWIKTQAADNWLDELDPAKEFFGALSAARKFEKTRNPFITSYLMQDNTGGRIHPLFHPLRTDENGARTGRLSSSHPNCFDGTTEVLTYEGWTRFDQLAQGVAVAQWENGVISFAVPTNYVEAESEVIRYSNDHIDLAVTPDHRCLLRSRKSRKLFVVEASQYPSDAQQLHSGLYEGPGDLPLSSEELRLICAIQADGHVSSAGAVDFAFHKKRKYDRLLSLLAKTTIPFHDASNETRFRIRLPLSPTLDILCSFLDPNKTFGKWVLRLNPHQMDVILEEIMYWDGCITRQNHYSSSKKENVNWIQAIYVLRGKRANIRIYTATPVTKLVPNYQVDVTHRDCSLTTNITKEILPVQKVYCLSVPSSFILIRRNGKTMVTGQCQNIPIRDPELGPILRSLFLPDEGMDMWDGDYNQVEYRALVDAAAKRHCTGAQEALQRYRTDPTTDFHVYTAELTGLPRYQAKSINFGIAFTMGAATLSKQLGLALNPDGTPGPEATRILDTYHAHLPFVRELSRLASDYAQKNGYIKTILGRRTRFTLFEPDTREGYLAIPLPYDQAVKHYGRVRRAQAHKSLNAYTQGSSADLVKSAMVLAWEQGMFKQGLITLSMTIHDEIAGSLAKTEEGQKALDNLREIMETAIPKFAVPIKASLATGANWHEAH